MKYSIRLLPEVFQDINEAKDWYESQQTGLGSQFIESFYAAIEVLPSAPFLYQIQFDNVRQVSVKRFAYTVYYRVEQNNVLIVATFHQAKDPKRTANEISQRKNTN